MTDVKRLRISVSTRDGGVKWRDVECPSGGYVRWDDHEREVTALRARVAELEAAPVVPHGWEVVRLEGAWCLLDSEGIAVEADAEGVTHAESAPTWAALRALEYATRTDQRPPHAGDGVTT